jgi:alpha-D-ribose 1-methylphosphonate 5-triphosphate diphosphatase PhnM
MDAHFNEYLAAVAGMAEIYGASHDDATCDEAHAAEEQTAVTAA